MSESNGKIVEASTLRLFKDTIVRDSNKYRVIKIIIPEWGIIEQGPLDKAEYLNETQCNDFYKIMGTRILESGQEIYNISIPGAESYDANFDANLLFVPDITNTTATPKIRYKNTNYTIKKNRLPILAGDLLSEALVGIRLNNSNLEAEIFSITQSTFSSSTRNNPELAPASGATESSRTLIENESWGCPIPVGGLLFLTQTDNPNTIYSGTSWEKLKGYYLKCTSDSETLSGITGGKNTKPISVSNLPAHGHEVTQTRHSHTVTTATHNHGQPEHYHETFSLSNGNNENAIADIFGKSAVKNDYHSALLAYNVSSPSMTKSSQKFQPYTSKNGGDQTDQINLNISCSLDNANITINNTGSGTEFNVEPSYYTVHTWKRLS